MLPTIPTGAPRIELGRDTDPDGDSIPSIWDEAGPVPVTTEILISNAPPEITVSTNPISLEGNVAGGWSGDLESVAGVTVSDPDPGDTVTLTHDAPVLLPLGDTTVTWTADDGDATTTAEQTVTVVDTTAPSLDSVADISVTTVDPNGATVSYPTPAASDIVDVAPVVSCDPVSASPFPVGVTTVTCSATDASGNVVSITFDVEVVLECTIIGTSGNDLLFGTDGDDVICGLGGNDILFGRRGDDRLIGGEGNDILFGSFGDDRLIGGEGDDMLFGNDGDDYLEGGPGFDFLLGGPGADILVQ